MKKKYPTNTIDTGRRVDQVVLDFIPNLTRSSTKSLLMDGIITVNNQRVRPNYKIKTNDVITYSPDSIKEFLEKRSHYSIKPVSMKIEVIYEDEHTLVVNKPSGITTHPVPGHREDTLLNGLVNYQQIKGFEGKIRPVHRLDKDTSGVILFAKSRDAQVHYSEQFEKNKVEKTYIAVVKGDFKEKLRGKGHVLVHNYLTRSSKEKKKMVSVPSHIGDIALSKIFFERYWILPSHKQQNLKKQYSLVKVMPKTGRTHQIRVHLSGLGYPILGDTIYSNTHFKRLMLHANTLKIRTFNGEIKEFTAKLPNEFNN